MGSMGSTCPMTPVDATMISLSSSFKASAASWHIFVAFSTPSGLQVLALTELTITAWAVPFFRCSRVTRMGAPLTLLVV